MNASFFSLRRLNAVMRKEFIQLKRDKSTFAMIAVLPIVQLLLFGYAINTDPKHMPTAIISRDNGIISRSFISALDNSDYFSVEYAVLSDKQAHTLLQQGKVQFVITIPENFERSLVRGDRPDILIEADATDPTAVSGAAGAVNGIAESVIRRDMNGVLSELKSEPPAFGVIVHKSYNPEGLTYYNIIPGLVGIILTMTGVMMTAVAHTRERERGTMENLLAMPVKPLEVMCGKIAPYIIIGYIQSFIIIGAAKILFNVPITGSLFLLSVSLLFFIICNLAMGFAVSTAAQNQTQALQMSIFILLPSILLTGFIFPFRGMPMWAQIIGNCLPMTYFTRIIRGILLKGAEFGEIWPHMWPLLVIMTVVTAIAMKLYKETLD